MNPSGNLQTINVSAYLGEKIITQTWLLELIKPKSLFEIIKRIARYANWDHDRPIENLTASQSCTSADPLRTRSILSSRRSRTAGETLISSIRALKSSQITSRIWNFSRKGKFLTSVILIDLLYGFLSSMRVENFFNFAQYRGVAHLGGGGRTTKRYHALKSKTNKNMAS